MLQNFMCHKYLDVNFGPNVNFIIGKNGSKINNYFVYSFELLAENIFHGTKMLK